MAATVMAQQRLASRAVRTPAAPAVAGLRVLAPAVPTNRIPWKKGGKIAALFHKKFD
jgi:hypothetical protein